MSESESESEGEAPNVLPPLEPGSDISSVSINAFVNNYTDRPDRLIAEIEKHDPGFVARMNKSSALHASKIREIKFKFGKHQAYTALIVQVIAAVSTLSLVAFALYMSAGFWVIIALALFML